MENTSARSFSEEHLQNLQKGAKRRHDEQLVGNYIRRVNSALFAQLLQEALHPQSKALANIIRQLEDSDLLPTVAEPTAAPKVAEPVRVEQPPANRPPPPRMDIL